MTIFQCDDFAENMKFNSEFITIEENEDQCKENTVKVSRCLANF